MSDNKPWYEQFVDFATLTFDRYVDFEIFDLQKDIYESQHTTNFTPSSDTEHYPSQGSASIGGIGGTQLLTYGLIGLGGYLLLKAVK